MAQSPHVFPVKMRSDQHEEMLHTTLYPVPSGILLPQDQALSRHTSVACVTCVLVTNEILSADAGVVL